MLGGKNRQPLGYTIIEVMIVLAVSGLMFVIAASFINGKQEKASFTEGVGQLASSIQDTIEQVTDGRYSDVPFTCITGLPESFSSNGHTQGTNSDCVFMGKFLHFNEAASSYAGSWSAGDDPMHYEVFTLAGNRLRYGAPVINRANAHAMAVQGFITGPQSGGTETGPDTSFDLTTQQTTPQNLQVISVNVVDHDTDYNLAFGTNPNLDTLVSTEGFGFVQTSSYGVTPTSGAQSLQLVYVYNLAGHHDYTESDAIVAQFTQTPVLYDAHHDSFFTASAATICVSDGTQYAKINVGKITLGTPPAATGDNSLNVSVERLGETACS